MSTIGTALAWGEPHFPMLLALWVCLSIAGGVLGLLWQRPNVDVSRLMWLSTAVFLPLCAAMVILGGGLDTILWVLIPLGCMTSAFAQQRSAPLVVALTTLVMAISLLVPPWLAGQAVTEVLAEVSVRCVGFAFVWFLVNQIFEEQSTASDARLASERRERALVIETAQLRERTREQRKMEALGRLAGGFAHAFNNLLTVMAGAADDALTEPASPPSTAALQDLSTAVNQARSLTQHMLDLSHSGVAENQDIDLRHLLRDSQQNLQLALGSSIQLVLSLADEPLTIRGERHELLRVLVSIAENAREAMDEGGTFQITASVHPEVPGPAYGRPTSEPESVVLTLSDNGRGMPASILERVFEPFFTTRGFHSHSGLGLTTAYAILTKHDGRVSIASEEGVGTTVTIRLPWRAPIDEALRIDNRPNVTTGTEGPLPEASEAVVPPRRPAVVLLDDEAMVLRTLKRLLRRAPFDITTYGEPEAFLSDVRDGLRYDILVTDVNMPHLTGVELVRCLEADGIVRPTLFVSGFSPENLDLNGFEGREYAFLPKPFDGTTLRAAVDRCLAQTC